MIIKLFCLVPEGSRHRGQAQSKLQISLNNFLIKFTFKSGIFLLLILPFKIVASFFNFASLRGAVQKNL